jgi:hypothetical protein
MKTKLVLVIKPNGVVDTGQKDGEEPYYFPCLDTGTEAAADKIMAPLAKKVISWCG